MCVWLCRMCRLLFFVGVELGVRCVLAQVSRREAGALNVVVHGGFHGVVFESRMNISDCLRSFESVRSSNRARRRVFCRSRVRRRLIFFVGVELGVGCVLTQVSCRDAGAFNVVVRWPLCASVCLPRATVPRRLTTRVGLSLSISEVSS